MNALGPLAKGLAFLMGKQPEEQQHPRGFLGLEWSEPMEPGRAGIRIGHVLAGSPAAQAGFKADDQIQRINSRAVDSLKEARVALGDIQAGDTVQFLVRRGSGAGARELRLVLIAGKGL
jgi:S1-C subfamily serine protease